MGIGRFFATRRGMIAAGALIGLMAGLLQYLGNPPNMGLCMVCFPRDMAGAIGLHRAAAVQYLRPEIIGAVWGALITALLFGEWRPRGGSAPIVRFMLGVFATIGALVFLGCPWRGLLRLAGGDWNSLIGLGGLLVGVGVGCLFLKSGYSLGRSHSMPKVAGWMFPGVMVLLLIFLMLRTSFGEGEAIFFSESGPGSMHAPVWVGLAFGLAVGALAQRTRFCTMGSLRDALLIRDYHLLTGVAAFLVAAVIVNLCTGAFSPGWRAMPISHMNHLWNFLGMVLAGLCFALGGGCPGRQLFLSGEGDGDAAIFCCGMIVGAGVTHNWFLAAVPDRMVEGEFVLGGPGIVGQIAVVVGILFCVVLGLTAKHRI